MTLQEEINEVYVKRTKLFNKHIPCNTPAFKQEYMDSCIDNFEDKLLEESGLLQYKEKYPNLIQTLLYKSYERGHSSGYQGEYDAFMDYVELVKITIEEIKR